MRHGKVITFWNRVYRAATLEEGQGTVSKELGSLEGVGEDGGGAVMRLEQRGAVAFTAMAVAVVRVALKLASPTVVRAFRRELGAIRGNGIAGVWLDSYVRMGEILLAAGYRSQKAGRRNH